MTFEPSETLIRARRIPIPVDVDTRPVMDALAAVVFKGWLVNVQVICSPGSAMMLAIRVDTFAVEFGLEVPPGPAVSEQSIVANFHPGTPSSVTVMTFCEPPTTMLSL